MCVRGLINTFVYLENFPGNAHASTKENYNSHPLNQPTPFFTLNTAQKIFDFLWMFSMRW